jgi:hypothetical protein
MVEIEQNMICDGRKCQKPDRQGGPLGKPALADARASDTVARSFE